MWRPDSVCVLASHTTEGLCVGSGGMGRGWVIAALLLSPLGAKAKPFPAAGLSGESGSKFFPVQIQREPTAYPEESKVDFVEPSTVSLISNRVFPRDKAIYRLMEFNVLKYQRARPRQRSPADTIGTLFPWGSYPPFMGGGGGGSLHPTWPLLPQRCGCPRGWGGGFPGRDQLWVWVRGVCRTPAAAPSERVKGGGAAQGAGGPSPPPGQK